jgi:phosphoribosylanthranilate isomerase
VPVDVKICGLRTQESVRAAVDGGARAVGFVFYSRSPRALGPDTAMHLARLLPTGVRAVGLFVDAADDELDAVVGRVPLDMLQLHGDEPPRRVAQIRARFNIPVMKAIRIGVAADLAPLADYEAASDWIMFDAKPPAKVATLPGGNGIAFDWRLLKTVKPQRPWMLAGGLTAENLAEAVAESGARWLDVSSGVEDRPGEKSLERIGAFLAAAAAL